MSLRKRTWRSPSGERKTAWLVDYRDAAGVRRAKQFARKRDAEAWQTEAAWQVARGTHTPDSQSTTIAKAGELWIARARRENLEPTSIAAYDQHLRLHINPLCGAKKLSQLTTPMIEGFRDDLLERVSRSMARRVLRSLSGIVGEAKRRGLVAQNVCLGVTVKRGRRDKPKPVIPSKAEVRAIIQAARKSEHPMDAALVLTYVFTGPRASELRGMTWPQLDLKAKTLVIDRRADAHNEIGPPKSATGFRTIPLADAVVSELRRWKLRCPRTELNLVFPSQGCGVISHRILHELHLNPVQIAAGVAHPVIDDLTGEAKQDESGEVVVRPKYASHALRHCAVSLWIDQRISPKRIQEYAGHHSVAYTFDTYGHLFAQVEADSTIMAGVEQDLLGVSDAT